MKRYKELGSNPNFANLEKDILSFWQQEKVFEESVKFRPARKNDKNNEFIFYDGPPFANGLPHYGHLLTGFIKDVFARYQTQKGKKVERRFGWDCHGLPAEMGAEKELSLSGRAKIMEYGIDKFNAHCRSSVLKYTKEWEEYVTRQGRWVDFQNDYKTMETPYMESVIWAFKELYNKGLVYESMRVMPYSWACETPLSNFETRMDNSYRERADKAITVTFELNKLPEKLVNKCKIAKLLAWTTTPWTLPSNLALAVGKEIEYACYIRGDTALIIGKNAAMNYKKELELAENEQPEVILTGEELYNLSYKPILPYFADHPHAFRILLGDFVVEGDGTSIVHIAPGFGEDDQILCAKENIELVCPVDNSGKFTQEVADFAGMNVFEANDEIIKKLKNLGSWLKTEQYLHNYPHCWRTDTPLIYKALPSWYVEVTKFRDRMVELNQQINWIPGHIKDGLFGKWLENARDWSISRNRFWGTPIPVWKSDDPKYPRIDVYGSIEELEKDFGVKVTDLHRPFIDQLTRPNPDDPTGKSTMRRVEDVFDCWFESGSMPYGQAHYPFENKEQFDHHFPADFIVEYAAQTRGWFYTLMVLSTALFDRPPFLNCICHGVVLDEKGQKLSKRLNNYADPRDIFANYGSDSLRWLMLSSSVMRGQELLIDKDGRMLRDILRVSIKPLWNSYHFFALYANADEIEAKLITHSDNLMDKYILSKLALSIQEIEQAMDNYDTVLACQITEKFLDILNNWYIRRSRLRFWKSEKDEDKKAAYNTLYTVLIKLVQAIASLMPFTCEEIYLNLSQKDEPKTSVHLTDFPVVEDIVIDHDLIKAMDRIQDVCNAVLSIRNSNNIRVRQPLKEAVIAGYNVKELEKFSEIIEDEVNVKKVKFTSDMSGLAHFKLKLNYPIIGKRIPEKIKAITAALRDGKWEKKGNNILIEGEIIAPQEYELLLDPINKNNSMALADQEAVIILDLDIDQELIQEGVIRDLIRQIQQKRKDMELEITARINLLIEADEQLQEVIRRYQGYIEEQSLSQIKMNEKLSDEATMVDTELGNIAFTIKL